MVNKAQARALLELIEELVSDTSMPYVEKRQKLLDEASENEQTAIEEFASWFEPAGEE